MSHCGLPARTESLRPTGRRSALVIATATLYFPAAEAQMDLESLMGSINAYKEGNEDSCGSCVAAGKEWCSLWDACDSEECEEEDVITTPKSCASLQQDGGKRPELAPGVLVEVLAARDNFYVEGDSDAFWKQMQEFAAADESAGELPGGEKNNEAGASDSTKIRHRHLFTGKYGFSPRWLDRLAENKSKHSTNQDGNDGADDGVRDKKKDQLEQQNNNFYESKMIPLVGVVVRAYHSLNEYTVKDDSGFELKHRIRHGPVTDPQKFSGEFSQHSVQDKEPVYFRRHQLRVVGDAVRKGDTVWSRFKTRAKTMSKRVEKAEVVSSTEVGKVKLRFLEDGEEAEVPRVYVEGLVAEVGDDTAGRAGKTDQKIGREEGETSGGKEVGATCSANSDGATQAQLGGYANVGREHERCDKRKS
eukprot:g3482.t1